MRIHSKEFSELIEIVKLLMKGSKEVPLYTFKIQENKTIEIQVIIGSYQVLQVFRGNEDVFEEYKEVTVSGIPLDKFESDSEEISILINDASVFVNLGSVTLNSHDKYGSKYTKILNNFDETNAKTIKYNISGMLSLHKSLNPIARENQSSYHFMKDTVMLYQSLSATIYPLDFQIDIEFSIPFRILPALVESYLKSEKMVKLQNTIVFYNDNFAFIIPFNEITNFNPLIAFENIAILKETSNLIKHLKQNQKEMFDITMQPDRITYSAILTDIDTMIQGFVYAKCDKLINFSVKASYLASILSAHSLPVKIGIAEDTLVIISNKTTYLSIVR